MTLVVSCFRWWTKMSCFGPSPLLFFSKRRQWDDIGHVFRLCTLDKMLRNYREPTSTFWQKNGLTFHQVVLGTDWGHLKVYKSDGRMQFFFFCRNRVWIFKNSRKYVGLSRALQSKCADYELRASPQFYKQITTASAKRDAHAIVVLKLSKSTEEFYSCFCEMEAKYIC